MRAEEFVQRDIDRTPGIVRERVIGLSIDAQGEPLVVDLDGWAPGLVRD